MQTWRSPAVDLGYCFIKRDPFCVVVCRHNLLTHCTTVLYRYVSCTLGTRACKRRVTLKGVLKPIVIHAIRSDPPLVYPGIRTRERAEGALGLLLRVAVVQRTHNSPEPALKAHSARIQHTLGAYGGVGRVGGTSPLVHPPLLPRAHTRARTHADTLVPILCVQSPSPPASAAPPGASARRTLAARRCGLRAPAVVLLRPAGRCPLVPRSPRGPQLRLTHLEVTRRRLRHPRARCPLALDLLLPPPLPLRPRRLLRTSAAHSSSASTGNARARRLRVLWACCYASQSCRERS